MSILKDPIILGILTTSFCYAYLKISRKYDETDDEQNNTVSFKYPILLGILVFIGVTFWKNNRTQTTIPIKPVVPMRLSNNLQNVNNLQNIGDALPRVFLEAI